MIEARNGVERNERKKLEKPLKVKRLWSFEETSTKGTLLSLSEKNKREKRENTE